VAYAKAYITIIHCAHFCVHAAERIDRSLQYGRFKNAISSQPFKLLQQSVAGWPVGPL